MRKYGVYRLPLMDGSSVLVRKLDDLQCLLQNMPVFTIFGSAVDAIEDKGKTSEVDDEDKVGPFDAINKVCKAALIDDYLASSIPLGSQLLISQWARGEAIDPGVLVEEREYDRSDFMELAQSKLAVFLDSVCHRYSVPPSSYLGFTGADFAIDLDIAMCYRGAKREASGGKDVGETKAKDMFGNEYDVPAGVLPMSEAGNANVVNMDDIAAQNGACAMSCGGGEGMMGTGGIGAMPSRGGQ